MVTPSKLQPMLLVVAALMIVIVVPPVSRAAGPWYVAPRRVLKKSMHGPGQNSREKATSGRVSW